MEKENKKQNNNIAVIAILALLLIAVLAFGIWAWSKYTSTLETGVPELSVSVAVITAVFGVVASG